MSWYYNYYLGYRLDGKIHVLGPFDNEGKLHSIISKSRSFASDLHEKFVRIKDSEITDELYTYFGELSNYGVKTVNVEVLDIGSLPIGDIVKKGYVLIEDVVAYENGDDDVFYDVLSPEVYAAKANNERMYGKNVEEVDEFGNTFHKPNASEYMYYAWVNQNSEEYESFILRTFYEAFNKYDDNDREYVVLLSQG